MTAQAADHIEFHGRGLLDAAEDASAEALPDEGLTTAPPVGATRVV